MSSSSRTSNNLCFDYRQQPFLIIPILESQTANMKFFHKTLLALIYLLTLVGSQPIPQNDLATEVNVAPDTALQARGIAKAFTSFINSFRRKKDKGIDWKTRTAKKNVLMETERGMLEVVKKGRKIPPGWKTPEGFINT
ncbi:hypothetical protein Slin15195_G089760 [Septoria linicola]|uniref:Uncharacterized protein n=1 Tax=Septoria linicola TaxID=215465 RepID=A0A9Q9ATR4_9PEZI|nr:hypothetical protein Slin14017_G092430 [Septoria linicola]USW55657.1 hypothetical protein Slin15195_G089760 [Septoria linicola]